MEDHVLAAESAQRHLGPQARVGQHGLHGAGDAGRLEPAHWPALGQPVRSPRQPGRGASLPAGHRDLRARLVRCVLLRLQLQRGRELAIGRPAARRGPDLGPDVEDNKK